MFIFIYRYVEIYTGSLIMRNIRIGNDIVISWSIYNDGLPYNLTDKDIKVIMTIGCHETELNDITVNGNVINFTYYGKDQIYTGKYKLKLIENEDVVGMHTVDTCNVFELVSSSCQVNEDNTTEITLETVNLATNVEFTNTGGGVQITIDSYLDSESENPVQNKVITNQINILNTSIDNEVSRAKSVEESLDNKIYNEVNRATGAESTLNTAITNEVSRATGAESSLNTAITNEVNRATGVESTLNTAITNEVNRAKGVESTLNNALKEKQDSLEGETILTINNTELALGGSITIEGGSGGNIEVDDKLSASSTNPVENKVVTAEIAAAIAEGKKQALHALFEAAGAIYNDTDEDIKRTFKTYGATTSLTDTFEFTHKPGRWYLNGVGDITDEEMISIYNAPHNGCYANAYFNRTNDKTFIFYGTGTSAIVNLASCFSNCYNLRALLTAGGFLSNSMSSVFWNSNNLKYVLTSKSSFFYGNYGIPSSTFTAATGVHPLEEIRVHWIKGAVYFSKCPYLSKNSILYMINNFQNNDVTTLFLHADAYAKCKTNGDWNSEIVAALSRHGEVTETDTTMVGGKLTLKSA